MGHEPPPTGSDHSGAERRQPAGEVGPDVIRRRRVVAAVVLCLAVALLAMAVRGCLGGDGDAHPTENTGASPAAREWARQVRIRADIAETNRIIDQTLAVTPVLRAANGEQKQIALTFDDGPGPFTQQVLDILDEFDVKATFFVIGGPSDAHAGLIRQEVARGHVVANHTVNHAALGTLSRAEQAAEIDGQTRAIELFGVPRSRIMRPPYNSWNETTLEILARRKMLMVLWSVETDDWRKPGAEAIVQRTLADAHPGAIVLFHDGGGDRTQTVEALPKVIEGLRNQGYELVTVPELIAAGPPQLDQREFLAPG